MPRRTRALASALTATATMALSTSLTGTAAHAGPGEPGVPPAAGGHAGDVRHVGPDYNHGKALHLHRSKVRQSPSMTALLGADPTVGTSKAWPALNDFSNSLYVKGYTLRGIGEHVQVWVADDTAFPDGDCRNTLGLAAITDAQVAGFVHEFDARIHPAESAAFSTPPDRAGEGGADLAGQLGLPADYWEVPGEQADDIVVLVDNVRDANYYDPSTPDGQTYVAGFFYSVFNELVDRNVMTIDAYDWLHRTGANPPDDSADPAYAACTQEQGAGRPYGTSRPHQYEGTFAHEYQHLLEYYEDPDEEAWVNEGLSDWAQTLLGYADPSLPPDAPGADGHLSCFQGFQPPALGGPENSLTGWGDQGGPEILCDYGAAYSFMEYLASHHGTAFMTALHRHDGDGIAGLDAVLDEFGAKRSAQGTIRVWAAAMALDSVIGDRGPGRAGPAGGRAAALSIASMDARINWDNAEAHDSPGAPPNGSDYVRLRGAGGDPLTARELRRVRFDGSATLEPAPVEWEESPAPPDATTAATTCGNTGEGSGPAALHSGCGADLDRSIVRSVSVPASGATLTFDALWDTESGWDFGFVQVSDDGGETWTSLATADTTAEADPQAVPAVTSQLPGFTGDSGSWRSESADLSAYAGQEVLVGFRYVTDTLAHEAGFWVRNIAVAGTVLPSSLGGWRTISQVSPTPVAGYTVQLVAYGPRGRAWYHRLRLVGDFHGALVGPALAHRLGRRAEVVSAIVMQDDPTESVTQYARYTLRANGVIQPGG